jgi:hypothetical protein
VISAEASGAPDEALAALEVARGVLEDATGITPNLLTAASRNPGNITHQVFNQPHLIQVEVAWSRPGISLWA